MTKKIKLFHHFYQSKLSQSSAGNIAILFFSIWPHVLEFSFIQFIVFQMTNLPRVGIKSREREIEKKLTPLKLLLAYIQNCCGKNGAAIADAQIIIITMMIII